MKLFRPILIAMLGASLTCAVRLAAQQTSPNSSSSSSMQQDSQPASMANSANNGASRITGCIRSEHGHYLLESKHHKMVALTGPEDFAPHVGHSVTLYGNFLPGTATSASARTSTSGSASNANFQVNKIEMVSDTCVLDQKDAKDKSTAPDQK
jgi:hypothetical protein